MRLKIAASLFIGCSLLSAAAWADQTVTGNLSVTGIADIQGNALQMGTAAGTTSTPGLIFTYVDGASGQ